MIYEWDENKRQANIEKHGIDFERMYGFEWDSAVNDPSPRDGEMRYIGIGYIGSSLHSVIYTRRGVRTRIISLRKASTEERDRYAQA